MPGTSKGSQKARNTILQWYGPDYYSVIGAAGGRTKNPRKGFGSNPELASQVGRLGGQKSKRGEAAVHNFKQHTGSL